MQINETSGIIVDVAMTIHQRWGPDLLESVYTRIPAHELRKRGLSVKREVSVPTRWDGELLDAPLRIDLLVEGLLIVEVKSVEQTLPVHKKQVLTCLRLTDNRPGLLLNFGAASMRDGIVRIVTGATTAPSTRIELPTPFLA
jgi:iron complex transport system substrate-binding protein